MPDIDKFIKWEYNIKYNGQEFLEAKKRQKLGQEKSAFCRFLTQAKPKKGGGAHVGPINSNGYCDGYRTAGNVVF